MLKFPEDWSFVAQLRCPGCGEPVAATDREYRMHVRDCARTTRNEKRDAEWALMFERRATKEHQRQALRMSIASRTPWASA